MHRARPFLVHQDPEIDPLLSRGDSILGSECKGANLPKLTPSLRTALTDLHLDQILILYPGTKRYPLAERVEVVPVEALASSAGIFG